MKKIGFSAAFVAFSVGMVGVAGAAYPVYQQQYQQQYSRDMNYQRTGVVQLPATNSTILTVNSAVAVPPTRVTGALPKVGAAATAAGRQYYQPADYDRLADSGLYVGISAAYAASISGSMHADYAGEKDAYVVPGAFADANFETDTVIPLQVSVGASLNNDVRVDFSYIRYSGLSYPDNVFTAD